MNVRYQSALTMFAAVCMWQLGTVAQAAPQGTAFTYQGQLKDGGSPASGPHEFAFSLWDDPNAGTQIGPTLTFDGIGGNPPPIDVIDGLFTVELDFGAAAFNGNARWLEIVVNGVPLSPRQPLTATPYATFAGAPWTKSGNNLHYNAGNVGIGTTTPNYPLTVRGTGFNSDAIQLRTPNGEDKWHLSLTLGGLDFVESHVAVNRLYLAPGGNVGIGTAVPANRLSVNGNANVTGNMGIGTTTAPLSRVHVASVANLNAHLESSSDIGTWLNISNSSAGGRFWRLISTGQNNGEGAGKLLIGHGASEGAHAGTAMTFTTSGVGIGTSSPTHMLTIRSPDFSAMRLIGPLGLFGWGARINFGDMNFAYIEEDEDDRLAYRADRHAFIGSVGIGTMAPSQQLHVAGNICATGTIGACSDGRYKDRVEPVDGALEKIEQLRGVAFDWKREEFPDHQFAEDRQLGFIAQEVEQVLPQIVSRGSDGYLSVDYGRLTPVLVEAVKELKHTNQRLLADKDAEIASLREEIQELRDMFRQLTVEKGASK